MGSFFFAMGLVKHTNHVLIDIRKNVKIKAANRATKLNQLIIKFVELNAKGRELREK